MENLKLGSPPRRARVTGATARTPRLRHLTLEGPDLLGVQWFPGQQFRVHVGAPGAELLLRTYSAWTFDPDAGRLEVLIHLHGNGPGSRWAEAAAPGDETVLFGPLGAFALVRRPGTHVFVGDETAIGPLQAMVRALPPECPAMVLLEVEDEGEEVPPVRGDEELSFVHRRGGPRGAEAPLRAAVAAATLPEPGVAYLAGEMTTCLRLRDDLLARGWTRKDIRIKPFWSPDKVGLT